MKGKREGIMHFRPAVGARVRSVRNRYGRVYYGTEVGSAVGEIAVVSTRDVVIGNLHSIQLFDPEIGNRIYNRPQSRRFS